MPRADRPTTVLLVRHGATTTTGRELPGRAPGLHLSDEGRAQADRVAARVAGLAGLQRASGGEDADAPIPADEVDDEAATSENGAEDGAGGERRRLGSILTRSRGRASADTAAPTVTAVYASPLLRTRETAAPIAERLGLEVLADEGLIELDVGDWTGIELKAARKRKEWATIQRYPSGFTFPGGESFVAMQARMTDTVLRLAAAHAGETIVAVSHADPIRAAVAHALGTHLDLFQRVVVSPCSITAIAYGDEGPTVLTVNDTTATGAFVPS